MKSSLLYSGNQPFSAQPLEKRKLKKVNIAFYELQIAREQSQIAVAERRFAKGIETRESTDHCINYLNRKISDIRAIIDSGFHMSNNKTDKWHKKEVDEAKQA